MNKKDKSANKLWYYYMDKNNRVHRTTQIEKWIKCGLRKKSWQLEDKPRKGVRVSTAFLGVDQTFGMRKPAILFETMIFGGRRNGETQRYPTIEEARRGHKEIIKSFSN